MNYRIANLEDLDEVIHLRLELLREEGAYIEQDIRESIRTYFTEQLNKTIIVMIAEENGKAVATSSVIFQEYPPSFGNITGMRAYIANVYTLPEYRKKGISTTLLDLLVDQVKKRNISYIWLWATEEGVSLYKKYGFDHLTAFETMDISI